VENSLNCSKNDKKDTPIYGGILFVSPISTRALLRHKNENNYLPGKAIFTLISPQVFFALPGKKPEDSDIAKVRASICRG
jgi:hypothetical protein